MDNKKTKILKKILTTTSALAIMAGANVALAAANRTTTGAATLSTGAGLDQQAGVANAPFVTGSNLTYNGAHTVAADIDAVINSLDLSNNAAGLFTVAANKTITINRILSTGGAQTLEFTLTAGNTELKLGAQDSAANTTDLTLFNGATLGAGTKLIIADGAAGANAGAIDGANAGEGTLVFEGAYTLGADVGTGKKLASIELQGAAGKIVDVGDKVLDTNLLHFTGDATIKNMGANSEIKDVTTATDGKGIIQFGNTNNTIAGSVGDADKGINQINWITNNSDTLTFSGDDITVNVANGIYNTNTANQGKVHFTGKGNIDVYGKLGEDANNALAESFFDDTNGAQEVNIYGKIYTANPGTYGNANASKYTFKDGAELHVTGANNLTINNGSTVTVEGGAELDINGGAKSIVFTNANDSLVLAAAGDKEATITATDITGVNGTIKITGDGTTTITGNIGNANGIDAIIAEKDATLKLTGAHANAGAASDITIKAPIQIGDANNVGVADADGNKAAALSLVSSQGITFTKAIGDVTKDTGALKMLSTENITADKNVVLTESAHIWKIKGSDTKDTTLKFAGATKTLRVHDLENASKLKLDLNNKNATLISHYNYGIEDLDLSKIDFSKVDATAIDKVHEVLAVEESKKWGQLTESAANAKTLNLGNNDHATVLMVNDVAGNVANLINLDAKNHTLFSAKQYTRALKDITTTADKYFILGGAPAQFRKATLQDKTKFVLATGVEAGTIVSNAAPTANTGGDLIFINKKENEVDVKAKIGGNTANNQAMRNIIFAGAGDVKFTTAQEFHTATETTITFEGGKDRTVKFERTAAKYKVGGNANNFAAKFVNNTDNDVNYKFTGLGANDLTFSGDLGKKIEGKSGRNKFTFDYGANNQSVIVTSADNEMADLYTVSGNDPATLNLQGANGTVGTLGASGSKFAEIIFTDSQTVTGDAYADKSTVLNGKTATFTNANPSSTTFGIDSLEANAQDNGTYIFKNDAATANSDRILIGSGVGANGTEVAEVKFESGNYTIARNDNNNKTWYLNQLTLGTNDSGRSNVKLDGNLSLAANANKGLVKFDGGILDIGVHELEINNGVAIALDIAGDKTSTLRVAVTDDRNSMGYIDLNSENISIGNNSKLDIEIGNTENLAFGKTFVLMADIGNFAALSDAQKNAINIKTLGGVRGVGFDKLFEANAVGQAVGKLSLKSAVNTDNIYGAEAIAKAKADGISQDVLDRVAALKEAWANENPEDVHRLVFSKLGFEKDGELDIEFYNHFDRATSNASQNAQTTGVSSVVKNVATAVSQATGAAIDNVGLRASSLVAAAPAAGDHDMRSAEHGAWFMPFGNKTKQKKRDKHNSGYDSKTFGASFGYDCAINNGQTTVGAAITFSDNGIKHKDVKSGDKTDITSYMLSAYGMHNLNDKVYLQGLASIGNNKIENKNIKKLGVNGSAVDSKVKGSYDAMSAALELKSGYRYAIESDLVVTPSLGFRYTYTGSGSYTEKGDNNALLNSVSIKALSMFELLGGVNVAKSMNCENASYTFGAHVDGSYNITGKDAKVRSNIVGLTADSPSNKGKPVRAKFNIGVDVNALTAGGFEYGVGYDFGVANKYRSHQVFLKARYNF